MSTQRPFPRAAQARYSGPLLAAVLISLSLLFIASAQAGSVPKLTLPQSMHAQIVADAMRIQGIPTRILAFRSTQDADGLADFFAGQWHDMHRSQAKPWTVLSHRDDDWLTTIQIRSAPMGQTRGFIAMSPLFKAIEDHQQPPAVDIPMRHGTHVVNDLQATDQGRRSRTLVLSSEQSVGQNLAFYRAYFKEQGYQPVGPGALAKDATGGAMILNRGNERLNVAVASGGLEGDAQTLITIVRVNQ